MGFKFNPLTGTLDLVNPKLDSPLLFKGSITAAADFPTSVEVKSGWFYTILADVTDNDGSKTNTGQSFFAGDEIAWNGSDWTALGNENVYVPYSGATSNVDLGVYSLTADAFKGKELNILDDSSVVTTELNALGTSYIKTDAGFNRALRIGPMNTVLDDGSYIEFTSSGSAGYGGQIGGIRDGTDGSNALVFLTGKNAQAERMRIDNDGNVSIGTTTPDEALDVVGNILAEELISVNSGTISRTSGVITSVAVTGGRTLTPTRTSGLITSITDGTRTWTFTYVDGLITAWTVS